LIRKSSEAETRNVEGKEFDSVFDHQEEIINIMMKQVERKITVWSAKIKYMSSKLR
jgi:hypothetical protein